MMWTHESINEYAIDLRSRSEVQLKPNEAESEPLTAAFLDREIQCKPDEMMLHTKTEDQIRGEKQTTNVRSRDSSRDHVLPNTSQRAVLESCALWSRQSHVTKTIRSMILTRSHVEARKSVITEMEREEIQKV